jgi:hypothetical protein
MKKGKLGDKVSDMKDSKDGQIVLLVNDMPDVES